MKYYIIIKAKGEESFWREDGLNVTEYSYASALEAVNRIAKYVEGVANNFEICIVRKVDGIIVRKLKINGGT